jgi:hypothetical protein
MKKIVPILISAFTGILGFTVGVIFQMKKDEDASEYAGTMRVYDPGDGEKPILFADPDVNIQKILKNGTATFHIRKLKVDKTDAV